MKKRIQSKFKRYKNEKREVLKNGNIYDKINGFIHEISLIMCITFAFFYNNSFFLSIRGIISDTISLSSIILGVLGVLLGQLVSLKEDSPFFKKAKHLDKDGFYFKELIKHLRDSFIANLFFVLYTLLFNLLPPNNLTSLKMIFISFWLFLFIKIIWKVVFLIILISKISIYTPPKKEVRKKMK